MVDTEDPTLDVCFTSNVNSAGSDIGSRSGVSSAKECQQICNANSRCKYFVFGKSAYVGKCFLKSDKATHLSQYDGLVFGPKTCGKPTQFLKQLVLDFFQYGVITMENHS